MSEQSQPSYAPLGEPGQLPGDGRPGSGGAAAAPQPAPPPMERSPEAPDAPAQTSLPEAPPAGFTSQGRVRRTRMSAWLVGLIIAAVLLVLLLIFIAQNSKSVTIHYVGFHGHVSLAIALLLSAVVGVLLVAIPGGARVIQLRRALKKNAPIPSPKEQRKMRKAEKVG